MARRTVGKIKLVHGVNPQNVVPHGTAAHRILLGIDLTKNPEAKAALEEQLQAPPVVAKDKDPIARNVYAAREEIFDGWSRQGR